MASRRDPREFGDMPAARLRKARGHPVAAMATEVETPVDLPDTPGVPDKSSETGRSDYKVTRTTRRGEEVRRATYWLTEMDLQLVERLQRVLDLPDTPGVPDKSAVIREAIRRLAAHSLDRQGEGEKNG